MVSECRPFVGTDEAGEGWAALGDPTRRAIVAALAERPRAVGELADELPVSRPAVSLALKVLKERFVVESPDRTRVELEHRNLDRHGPGWEAVRDGIADDAGWPLYLDRYAALFTEGR